MNHIRDQLIPPAERNTKRKRKIWEQVKQYIHESESRVREDVQKVRVSICPVSSCPELICLPLII